MSLRSTSIGLAVACVAVLAGPVLAGSNEEAGRFFAQGQSLLAQGDFDGALAAYANAAKANSENEEYRQQYALLCRITKMRESIARQDVPAKWEKAALALRSFYYANEIYTEALSLDQETHLRLKNAESATMLAETELALGMNAEAAELLGGLEEGTATRQSRMFEGIALSRLGKVDEARKIADQLVPSDEFGPGLYFDFARLRALLGDTAPALRSLTRTFELTPPSRLEAFKTYAKACPDLAGLVGTADFAKVLETQSTVKESSCSGGTSCGKCPNKAKCSHASGKPPTEGGK
ncbi:MAG TPA: hypothetical protein VM243_17865 [Phycisphaerae bacterium]|nr:hypothetical protein [Phycisphaerae bacterium]